MAVCSMRNTVQTVVRGRARSQVAVAIPGLQSGRTARKLRCVYSKYATMAAFVQYEHLVMLGMSKSGRMASSWCHGVWQERKLD